MKKIIAICVIAILIMTACEGTKYLVSSNFYQLERGMTDIEIHRSPTQVTFNDIPENMLGVEFNLSFGYNFAAAPPIKDNTYFLKVLLTVIVVDHRTQKDLYKLETETNFSFKATMSENDAIDIMYQCYLGSVTEFNLIMEGAKSNLLFAKKYQDFPYQVVRNQIIGALRFNSVN